MCVLFSPVCILVKVKVVHGLEPVPKELESKLPPQSEGSGSDDDSDFSWDEESVIDGHAWWEVGSQDEVRRIPWYLATTS